MDKNSIISSFKRWVPPAGILAVALVLMADLFVAPRVPAKKVFAFDQNNYDRPGLQDYEAMRVLLTYPQQPADIAIMGSSRPRDGILVPDLEQMLIKELGRSVQVANYAAVGFRAFDFEILADRLVAPEQATPRVVVLPINPRFLQENAERDNLRFTLMRPRHLLQELRVHGLQAPLHITETLLSNGVAKLFSLRLAAREWTEGTLPKGFDPVKQNPIFGGFVKLQNQDLRRLKQNRLLGSIAQRPLKKERVAEYVAVEWPPGVKHLGEDESNAFKNGLSILKAAGVRVLLMDLPMSIPLKEAIPQEGFADYHGFLKTTAQEVGIDFVGLSDFPPFTGHDFREQSHMNHVGAIKLTDFIATVIIQKYGVPLGKKAN